MLCSVDELLFVVSFEIGLISIIDRRIRALDKLEEQARLAREKYGDIIDLPRPVSKRGKMSMENRAAQFAPFAALTGFHESVDETETVYSREHESGGVSYEKNEDEDSVRFLL